MQAQLDPLAGLRARLKALPRKKVRQLAIEAGLSPSTVEKIRGGHIKMSGHDKVVALESALQAQEHADAVAERRSGNDRRKTERAQ